MIRKTLQNGGLTLASLLVTLLIAEGVYALVRGDRLDTSLSFKALGLVTQRLPGLKSHQDLEIYAPVITRPEAFDELLDAFKADGVALGNSQYVQLRTDRAELNTVIDGCKAQKANLDKEMTYLRAGLYEPFSRPSMTSVAGCIPKYRPSSIGMARAGFATGPMTRVSGSRSPTWRQRTR